MSCAICGMNHLTSECMQPTGYGCDTKPNAVPNAKPMIEAQAKIIMDAAIAARDKWFIKTIEDRFGDGHDKPLIQIGVQDWQDFKASLEVK